MRWRPRHKVPAAPALAAGLLAAGLAVQAALPWQTPLPPAPPARAATILPPPPIAPVAEGVTIRARALFSPSRTYAPGLDRAADRPGAAAPSAPDPAQTLTLLGSARAGRRAVAVFRDGTGQSVTTAVGGRVSGWRLATLGRDRAVLTRAGQRRTLRLGVADSGAAAAVTTGGFGAPAAAVDVATGENEEQGP